MFLKLHPMKFPASPSQILLKEHTHIETFIHYLTECLDVKVNNDTKPTTSVAMAKGMSFNKIGL